MFCDYGKYDRIHVQLSKVTINQLHVIAPNSAYILTQIYKANLFLYLKLLSLYIKMKNKIYQYFGSLFCNI